MSSSFVRYQLASPSELPQYTMCSSSSSGTGTARKRGFSDHQEDSEVEARSSSSPDQNSSIWSAGHQTQRCETDSELNRGKRRAEVPLKSHLEGMLISQALMLI